MKIIITWEVNMEKIEYINFDLDNYSTITKEDQKRDLTEYYKKQIKLYLELITESPCRAEELASSITDSWHKLQMLCNGYLPVGGIWK
jgi:hypothetical protein